MPCQFGGYLTYTKDDGSTEEIPWSHTEDYGRPPPAQTDMKCKPALLLEEEVWQLVQEWYKSQGRGVPAEEAKACLLAIREAKKPKEPEPERPKTAEEILGPRPGWGDPMFWPWWNKAKALGLVKPKSPKVAAKAAPQSRSTAKADCSPKQKKTKK